MSLHNREICKVGESPSRIRRCSSPCRMTTVITEPAAEISDSSQAGVSTKEQESPKSPKSPKLSPRNTPLPSTSSSTPTTPDMSAKRVSARMLMQKGDRSESVVNKNSKSPKHAAWKTSKFFSRSMASGELLKGFKKLSIATSTTTTTTTEDANTTSDSNKNSESRSFKNRFSSLRRKSGSDTDKVPVVDAETLKHGSSDVKGIVCKKEDIMSLIEVSKERRVSSPGELTIPPSLPIQAVPVLKSPSLKIPPDSPLNRGNFRSSRSSSLDPTMIPNERLLYRPQAKLPLIRTVVHPPSKSSIHRISDDIYIQKKSFLDVTPDTKRRLSGPLIEIKENKILETNGGNNDTDDAEDEEPAVQWDEGNFVDPNLLGGAIEAFLKGMGSVPGPSTSEKRVSFKKT